jgi:hypothetical protein
LISAPDFPQELHFGFSHPHELLGPLHKLQFDPETNGSTFPRDIR